MASVFEETPHIPCLGDFYEDAVRLDLDKFITRHADGFLLHHGPIGELSMPLGDGTTQLTDGPTTPGRPFNPEADFLVFALRRRRPPDDRDPFIWLGRSPSNDVVIPDTSVSAVHAFVQRGAEGEFLLQDMNSRNGTYLDDVHVLPRGQGEPVPFDTGCRIQLGGAHFNFLQASEFRHLVATLLG